MPKLSPVGLNHKELIELYREALLKEGSYEGVEKKVADKYTRMVVSQSVEERHDQQQTQALAHALPKAVRYGANFLPALLIFVGILLLGSAVMPVVGYYIKMIPQTQAQKMIVPIPSEKVLDVTPLVISQTASNSLDEDEPISRLRKGPVIVDAQLDYTNLSNWFEDQLASDLVNRTSLLSKQSGEYILEIPDLNIHNAVVKIGGVDLEESLIQYPGTSLPGKPGSPVVFGHSLLRQFYNPKESNPRRYNSIFSTIMTLEKGDKIYLHYADVRYTYIVESKTEVKPTDTYILSQDYGVRQLKLVTCTPEGTYLRRGVITAQLIRDD